uniref:Odorant receptor n=1 Tax=Bradysia odoriphaga TaxID=1564500 RepID=A0A6B9CEQ8_9DIPT|nr:odorant receptor 59 [Bradysia odoriphaga]
MEFVQRIVSKVKQKLDKNGKVAKHETASERMAVTLKFVHKFTYPLGFELTNEWQFSLRTAVNVFVKWFTWFLIVYTIYLDFPSLDDVVVLGGTSVHIIHTVKFIIVLLHHKKFMSLLNFILKVYKVNVTGNREWILANSGKTISYHFKCVIAGSVAGAGLYSFWPCYDFLVNGNLTKVSPLIIPFLNDEQLKGYLIATIINIAHVVFHILGTFAMTCVFIVYVDVYDDLVSLIEDDFKLFDAMCEKGVNDSERQLVFRNIIRELMDLARYNSYMNDLFTDIATVECVCCYIGTVACLFGYFAVNFTNGIGAIAYFATELLMVCYIGQLVDNTTCRITDVINNTKWYIYDVKYQKDILLVLDIVSRVKPILILKLHPLNFATGLMIIKNIYTLTMFMLNFLE